MARSRTGHVLVAALALAIAGCSSSDPPPTSSQSTSSRPLPTDRLVATTDPTPQPGHPQLGGTTWSIVELGGTPADMELYLSFWGGRSLGRAEGDVAADCFQVTFSYTYDPGDDGIAFDLPSDGDGSYAEGCTPTGLAAYADVQAALRTVVSWRMPPAGALDLFDAGGTAVISAGPPPPLPTPPPGGDCGTIPEVICLDAATKAFNSGLFPEPGQVVLSWSVRETIYVACASGLEPKYDVIFELGNPSFEKIAVVGEVYGRLVACGDY